MAKKFQCEVPKHKNTTKNNFVATWVFTDGSPHKWNFTEFFWVVFRNICNAKHTNQYLFIVFDNFGYIRVFRLKKSFVDLSRKLCVLTLIAT